MNTAAGVLQRPTIRRNADSTGGKQPAKQMTGLHGGQQTVSYIPPPTSRSSAAQHQQQQPSEAAAAPLSPTFLVFN